MPFTELDRVVVATCIGELSARDGIAAFCREVTARWGPSCAWFVGPAPAGAMTLTIGDRGALVLGQALEPAIADRVARLFLLLAECVDPVRMDLVTIHRVRNRLAGVLTNVEFVEMVVEEAPELADDRIGAAQRAQLLAALAHARRSGRDLVEIVRTIADGASAVRP